MSQRLKTRIREVGADRLWREAYDRYAALELSAGVGESAARLAMLSSQRGVGEKLG